MHAGPGRDLRVAVVEDDGDLRRLFTDVFEDAGFAVTAVATAERFPAAWRGDVIVTDSGSRAYEPGAFAQRMRLLRGSSGARIVLVSAHVAAEVNVGSLGVDAFVQKPFEVEELIGVVRSLARV